MLRDHLLVTLRNIRNRKLFSVINLAGLSLALSASMLIFLFVANEVSYDRFHDFADRMYRIGLWDKSRR
jgi:putative ABC transport system permease protein